MNETIKCLVEQLNNNDKDLNQLYHIHSLLGDASNVDKNDACIITVAHYLDNDELFDVAMAFALRAYNNFARMSGAIAEIFFAVGYGSLIWFCSCTRVIAGHTNQPG